MFCDFSGHFGTLLADHISSAEENESFFEKIHFNSFFYISYHV